MNRLFILCYIIIIQSFVFLFATQKHIRHNFANDFCIVKQDITAPLIIDSTDYRGVIRASIDLQSDIKMVSGASPAILSATSSLHSYVIIIGTIGKNKSIDNLIINKKLNVESVRGKWEAFRMQIIDNPFPNIKQALVIAGSDKRGTIYGIYELSRQIGVSPWYWWADVLPQKKSSLTLPHDFYQEDYPAVKYRGIFINDEAPALSSWVKKKFGSVPSNQYPRITDSIPNCNHIFYSRVFELLLRLKANYLWPAMWANAFNEDDPENPRLADEYGIVMGTSHQEPMLRSQQEWDRRYYSTLGHWNYTKYPDTLEHFWREGIRRNKNYESIITMGLRGANDTEMGGDLKSNIAMVETIVKRQQKILQEELNPDLTQIPQMWCLYKEVQEYYENGLKVPDYITLLWSDDNWGNLRRLPSDEERKRIGGAGIYYHADYVGGPRSYKWINTLPVTKIWDQMTKAYENGADRIWIMNVGDLKPLELPIDFFLNLAWNPRKWNKDNLTQYTFQWAQQQFGQKQATAIADILNKYTKYNGWIKPELLSPNTFSLINYREAEKVIDNWRRIADEAESIYTSLPEGKKDAFFELVLYPVKASYIVNDLYFNVARNRLYVKQGRISALNYAAQAKNLFAQDSLLTEVYHKKIAGGKWDGMMNQPHIGYTGWRDPAYNIMPQTDSARLTTTASIGLSVEGDSATYSTKQKVALPQFSNYSREKHYFELFAQKAGNYGFSVKPLQSWIIPSETKGTIKQDKRIEVTIDWDKAPKDTNAQGEIVVQLKEQSFIIYISLFNPLHPDRNSVKGFVESNGYIAMEAEHFSSNKAVNGIQWQRIPDYGKALSSMMPLPVTASSFTDLHNAPTLEYDCYLFTTGKIKINTFIAPTLNCLPDADMRFAIAIDNEQPQIVQIPHISITGTSDNQAWSQSVINNVRICQTEHHIPTPGHHKVKIFMIDPIITLQRVIIDTGGLKKSFFGPPESFYKR